MAGTTEGMRWKRTPDGDIKAFFKSYKEAIARVKYISIRERLLTATKEELEEKHNLEVIISITDAILDQLSEIQKTIYRQRRNHRLPDWHMFCDWVESLPDSHLITGKNKEDDVIE